MKKIDRFQIGHAYQHHSGQQLYITGIVDSMLYGITFIAQIGYNTEKLKLF